LQVLYYPRVYEHKIEFPTRKTKFSLGTAKSSGDTKPAAETVITEVPVAEGVIKVGTSHRNVLPPSSRLKVETAYVPDKFISTYMFTRL
jgi:hypothetical protein